MKKTTTKNVYVYEPNDRVALFYKITKMMYFGTGTNFMFDDLNTPATFVKVFSYVSKVFELLILMMICSQWGAFLTQHNLSMIYKSQLWMFAPTSLTLYAMYINALCRKQQIKQLSFTIAVTLRKKFTNDAIEKRFIQKTWRYIFAFIGLLNGLFFSTGIVTGYVACTTNETFTTMIPAWPDMEDRSLAAAAVRIAHYCVWYIFIMRFGSIYFIILAITIGLQHQYSILCDYFLSLNSIFDGEGSQEEKEKRYEDGVKHGIKMHSLTLWCMDQTQTTSGVAVSCQVITNIITLIMLMVQWMHMKRTFGNCLNLFLFVLVTLTGTGIFMWNAGDVTFEAAKLPTAMFHSGWYNCRGRTSVRARKLITIAMQQAQDRVVIKGFGIIELSYESYISMVKFAYSVFSVMY